MKLNVPLILSLADAGWMEITTASGECLVKVGLSTPAFCEPDENGEARLFQARTVRVQKTGKPAGFCIYTSSGKWLLEGSVGKGGAIVMDDDELIERGEFDLEEFRIKLTEAKRAD